MKFRKFYLIIGSLLSGILLTFAWPERGFPFLLFLGLVPMFFVEDYIFGHRDKFIKFSVLFYTYPGFFIWNLLTTWWIANSTLVGAILAIALNSLFMSIVFQLFHWSKKKLGFRYIGYAALISFWVAFEYLHLNWDLNWPWLNLGNGFSSWYKWVQWYEYTGTFGGTLWILIANILLYELLLKFTIRHQKHPQPHYLAASLFPFLWILIPILISYVIYFNYREEKHPVTFVIVQPNIDPYSEQYSLPPEVVISRIMALANQKVDSSVNFLVAPESAIQESMWENDLSTFTSIHLLRDIIQTHPNLNILIGGSTFYQFRSGASLPRWARKFTDTGGHYAAYNAAIMINSEDSLQLYHKSKLTPGVEILPSFKGFNWLEKYAIDLGGTVGSLGMDSIRKVYTTVGTIKVSAAICYESIFGEFFAKFVRNGAQAMIIITNDGWWGNTAGHKQHFDFAHLRAIETRRCIARSANTGISAFLNQRGDVIQKTEYWKPAVIKEVLNANSKHTFYVDHGDYLARFFSWLALIIFLTVSFISISIRFKKNSLHKKT